MTGSALEFLQKQAGIKDYIDEKAIPDISMGQEVKNVSGSNGVVDGTQDGALEYGVPSGKGEEGSALMKELMSTLSKSSGLNSGQIPVTDQLKDTGLFDDDLMYDIDGTDPEEMRNLIDTVIPYGNMPGKHNTILNNNKTGEVKMNIELLIRKTADMHKLSAAEISGIRMELKKCGKIKQAVNRRTLMLLGLLGATGALGAQNRGSMGDYLGKTVDGTTGEAGSSAAGPISAPAGIPVPDAMPEAGIPDMDAESDAAIEKMLSADEAQRTADLAGTEQLSKEYAGQRMGESEELLGQYRGLNDELLDDRTRLNAETGRGKRMSQLVHMYGSEDRIPMEDIKWVEDEYKNALNAGKSFEQRGIPRGKNIGTALPNIGSLDSEYAQSLLDK